MNMKYSFLRMMHVYLLVVIVGMIMTHIGNRSVTVMAERSPIPDRTCIIIDAGHGGIDGGAISCTGVTESEINLQIAMRFNDLMHFLGYKTIMLREADTSLHTEGKTIAQQKISDLKHRVNIVNNTENALLISIHQNTFSDKKYSGAQIFYSAHEESKKLAEQLQASIITRLNPSSKRKSKAATGIYLMEHIQCNGVLIECGFLTNPEEEAKLRSSNYQKNLCCVIGCSLSCFLNS